MTLLIEAMPVPLKQTAEGTILVEGTRIPLDTIVALFNNGHSPAQIVEGFDTLALSQVYAVITFYLRNRVDVDAYLEARGQQAAEIRREWDARHPQDGLRERLVARQPERK